MLIVNQQFATILLASDEEIPYQFKNPVAQNYNSNCSV